MKEPIVAVAFLLSISTPLAAHAVSADNLSLRPQRRTERPLSQSEIYRLENRVRAANVEPEAFDEIVTLGHRAVPFLIETLLHHRSATSRKNAARALGAIKDERAIDPLIQALGDIKDRELAVLWSATWALRDLGKHLGTPVVVPLIQALHDRRWSVRAHAAIALGEIGDGRAVGPLLQAARRKGARKGANEKETVRIVEALGELKDTRATEYLSTLLSIKAIYRHGEVPIALGKIRDPRAVEPLIRVVKNKKMLAKIRQTAVMALGEIGDRRAVEPLIEALSDPDQDIRENAAEALGQLKDKRAVAPLLRVLRGGAFEVRYQAVYALGELGDPRAVPPLIRMLKSKDSRLHGPAVNALVAIATQLAQSTPIPEDRRTLRTIARTLTHSHGGLETETRRFLTGLLDGSTILLSAL